MIEPARVPLDHGIGEPDYTAHSDIAPPPTTALNTIREESVLRNSFTSDSGSCNRAWTPAVAPGSVWRKARGRYFRVGCQPQSICSSAFRA
jgi:hypothetical protein